MASTNTVENDELMIPLEDALLMVDLHGLFLFIYLINLLTSPRLFTIIHARALLGCCHNPLPIAKITTPRCRKVVEQELTTRLARRACSNPVTTALVFFVSSPFLCTKMRLLL